MSDTPKDRFSEERSAYTVRGSDKPDIEAGVAAIRSVLKTLPVRPGVYRMCDVKGDVLYVGKARSLKARVSNYARLGGKFALETSGGRFTEMEPGIAKLLGVLSLQSLPRRLSFNFDDIFGKGFAFDEIKADVAIADGVARTDGFVISGPSARVQIRGNADINREAQDLQVRVYPSLSTATAIGIGLATANPAIGAAALLGQKLARDPIERMLMQEFEVKGTWTTPDVKQTRATAGAATPAAVQ